MSPLLRSLSAALAIAVWLAIAASPAAALIVENTTGTNSPASIPGGDPGWNYVSTAGRNYVYLGDGWALSAFHVGVPATNELLNFNGGSFRVIPNQAYGVTNPSGSGLTTNTDLRLIRINGDPALAPLSIASQQLFENTTTGSQRDVVIIGNGFPRQANQTQWNVTVQPGSNNDIWTEVPSGGQHVGYKSDTSGGQAKLWGTNRIADEDCLFNNICPPSTGGDNDFRGQLQLALGIGTVDVMSMITKFESSGPDLLPNEAQVVSGDSGSAVFSKRSGQWELIGIVNAIYSTYENQSTANAVYGNYTTFADLTYYRSQILNIMNAHSDYSLVGDVNLDGVVTGNGTGSVATDDISAMAAGWLSQQAQGDITSWKKGDMNHDGVVNSTDFLMVKSLGDINLDGVVNGGTTGGVPSGDVAAFVAGWGYNNGTGIGDIASWKHGDLNFDGRTDVDDFLLLRTALIGSGSGSFTLASVLGGIGVPEPSSLVLALAGAVWLARFRGRRP